MNKLFSIALIVLVFASCQNPDDSETIDSVTSTPNTFTTPTAPTADSNTQAVITNTPTIIATPAVTTAGNSLGKEALNPAHGAPGHRCDIAVGAPLSSPAGSAPAPTMSNNPAPTMQQTQAPAQPVNNNVRLNPAHGEPGHDCKIPVGQSLKS